MTILRVALDVPVPTLFDYRSEDATRADIGYRVLVPFGKKRLVGVIWDVATKSKVPDSRLRPIEKILRDVTPLPRLHRGTGACARCFRGLHRAGHPNRNSTHMREGHAACWSAALKRVGSLPSSRSGPSSVLSTRTN